MNENLLVITTAGHLNWLREAISTLRDKLDVLVVDDATPGNKIRDFCKKRKIPFITKKKAKGLTSSWNIGYDYFKQNKYRNCIISNDDVRFPEKFSEGLLKGVKKFNMVGPLSNNPGYNHWQRIQKFIKQPKCKDIDRIQKIICEKYRKNPFRACRFINGFCFAFSSSIGKFMFSGKLLFNPQNININNEYDLARRVRKCKGKVVICKTSYVYHIKCGTYKGLKLEDRNQLWR